MTTLYHTLFVDRMYSLEHNNMTAAPVIKGNTSGFLSVEFMVHKHLTIPL